MLTSSHPYVLAFAGGLLIGLATTIHLLLKGRITGMSGIFYGLISPDSSFTWRSSLVSGLLFASCFAYHLYGFNEVPNATYLFDPPQIFAAGASPTSIILAGFLVGLGTRLGSGCTSGHGVCGLPRFSPRSLVAVMTFMATGILTANLKPISHATLELHGDPNFAVNVSLAISLLTLVVNFVRNKSGIQGLTDIIVSFIVGSIFTIGLMVSGMSRKTKVLGFLTFDKDWDMSLMFVMGGAVLLNVITFNYIIHVKQKPILAERLSVPTLSKIDFKLISGAGLFGIGWGIAGICPGPAMIVTPMYFSAMIKFMLSMGVGQYLVKFIEMGTQKLKIS